MVAPIKPIDGLLAHIATAVEQWKAENTPEEIHRTVNERLNKEAETIMLQMLGFSHSCGRWELDRFNGRVDNSSAGKYLQEHQSEAIKAFLSTVDIPKTVSESTMKELRRAAKVAYDQKLHWVVEDMARAQAEKDAKALVDSIVKSDQIQNYLKLTKLINPEPQQES